MRHISSMISKSALVPVLILFSSLFLAASAHAATHTPKVVSVSPINSSSVSGAATTFTTVYTDTAGYANIYYSRLGFVVSSTKTVYGQYDIATNKLYLLTDAANGFIGGFAPGSANLIENTYGMLDCSKTTVSRSGTKLTIKWNIIFKNSFVSTSKKTVYMYAKDKAGSASGVVKKGTWLVKKGDATAPTGTIKINNNATSTNSTTVNLTLSAVDNKAGCGIYKMKFSTNNSTWTTPEAYKTTKSFTLPTGDGTKTVYVKFSDKIGNWSGSYSDSIVLDATAPKIVITSPADGITVTSPNLTVNYTVDGVAKTKQFTLTSGQNTVTITETDAAGNVGSVSIIVTYSTITIPNLPSIVKTDGYRLMVQKRNVNGTLSSATPYIVKGVNWSPASKDTTGPEVSETDMRKEIGKWCNIDIPLIKNMNANTIRTFQDFGLTDDVYEKDWKYVLDKCYENGIMVIMTVDRCIADTGRITNIVNTYKNHPAILMWLVGNEWTINNFYGAYGNINSSAAALESAASLIKTLDTNHPVATSVGDLTHPSLDTMKGIIENTCPSVDIWGFNLYRGRSFSNLFDQWNDIGLEYKKKPLLVTEFGCDAYDINTNKEDQIGQRTCEYYQWKDLSKNLSADDPAKTSIGGCVFAFSDEWWKVSGTVGTHDAGGWSTNNCPDGHASEEWWGIVDIDRNPRLAYQLFKEYFGGLTPEAPPADTAEDYNVVRFSTQPDTITTNIATYPVFDVFKDATTVTVNDEAVTLDYYDGFAKDVTLTEGTNTISVTVKLSDGTEKNYQKTVVYDPSYSTASKEIVYAGNVAIDLDAGAVLGRLSIPVAAVTHNGKYFIDTANNVYSTATNQRTGTTLALAYGEPIFSNDDKTAYAAGQALDFATNTITTSLIPANIRPGYCSIDSNGYIYYYYINVFKKIDPATFAVLVENSALSYNSGFSCVSKDGTVIVGNWYSSAAGRINIMDIATLKITSIGSLSDYMGDVVTSDDDAKMFVGAYGNSYYGKGGIYVVDKNIKALSSFYHQYGASHVAASSEYVFATSTVVDHYYSIGSTSNLGALIQGSIYHRGVEMYKLNEKSALEYQKSFFIGLEHNYSAPTKIYYKKKVLI